MTRNDALTFAVNKGYIVDKNGIVTFNGKERHLSLDRKGYYRFCVQCEDGKKVNLMVHRLQAYQKFGDEIFKPGIVVRHLNGISTDNSYDNIEIGTHSDNMMDKPKDVRVKQAKLAASHRIKFHNVDEIKEFHNKYKSYQKTMAKFNIPKATLCNLLNNR